jgi:hypothetical integral membrane protein (TIGR02206 family)
MQRAITRIEARGLDPTRPARWRDHCATVKPASVEHVATLVATTVAVALLVGCARRRGNAFAAPAGRIVAVAILAAYACEHLVYALRGRWSVQLNLPLHLTDAVTLAAVAALWRPQSALLVELVYFWALSASLQAVLTPDLGQDFPDILFFTYFITHCGAIVAACLLVFGTHRTPRPHAVLRTYAITLAFTALAAVGSVLTGGNYMYLRRKPARGSLLDLMGPWPVYIAVAAGLGLLILLILDAGARRMSQDGTPRSRGRVGRDRSGSGRA